MSKDQTGDPAPAGVDVYEKAALEQVPRLLGNLDREAASLTFGNMDREHWAWKFRDFPITMLQAGVYPLALLWRYDSSSNPLIGNVELLEWMDGSLAATCHRQAPNGSFDSVAPFSCDHGVTLAMAWFLGRTLEVLGNALPEPTRKLIPTVVGKCCEFALRSEEDYAFISNHQALHALGLLKGFELTGENKFRTRAARVVHKIIDRQAPGGWYEEYGGCDPGYETLCLYYLAWYWKRTGDEMLLQSIRRSVQALAYFVHPDASLGGSYGSRNTSLYFPGGLEILAQSVPMAAAIAGFLRPRLRFGNVVTPASADTHNLAILLSSYLDALLEGTTAAGTLPDLPMKSLQGLVNVGSEMAVAGTDQYYAVVGLQKGGACRIFGKHTEKIAYEDAGYLIRSRDRLWSSQIVGLSKSKDSAENKTVLCKTTFGDIRQSVLTPGKFLILRLLNLTLFRSISLGKWIRRMIIRELITGRRPVPLQLLRRITFEPDRVQFHDTLTLEGKASISSVKLSRNHLGIHMGSAKYFHSNELVSTAPVPVEHLAELLSFTGKAEVSFELVFVHDRVNVNTQPTLAPKQS